MTSPSPESALRRYRACLQQLRSCLGGEAMVSAWQELNNFFQQQLWPLLIQRSEQADSAWQAMTTELHRHMRLLGLEIQRGMAARQLPSRQQRQEQIEQRLVHLEQFSQGLMQLLVEPSAD